LNLRQRGRDRRELEVEDRYSERRGVSLLSHGKRKLNVEKEGNLTKKEHLSLLNDYFVSKKRKR